MSPQHAIEHRFRRQVDPLIGQAWDNLARRQSGVIRLQGGLQNGLALVLGQGVGRRRPHRRGTRVSAVLSPALPGAGGDAQHRTGRFQSGPSGPRACRGTAWASSISDTASWRSGVLIMRPRPPPRSPGLFLPAAGRFDRVSSAAVQPALRAVAEASAFSLRCSSRFSERTSRSTAACCWPRAPAQSVADSQALRQAVIC